MVDGVAGYAFRTFNRT